MANPRYVWVNLDTDMISIGTTDLVHFEEYYNCIKRSRLAREDDKNEYWARSEYHDLGYFINLEELHLVSLRGMCGMNLEFKPDFPCTLDITWIVDPIDGDMMPWRDVENMVATAIEDTYARHGETGSGYPEGELIRVEKYSWDNQRLPTAVETRRWL
ncbi:Hypothetical protein D9617_12g037960 [Elsinoe fawcettii]|nr:Hypothetical protein D9617_12g037960 [Elsinoe fawcettii]